MVEQERARILVVDDEETIRFSLEVLLQRRGYAVTAAASGGQALACFAQHAFDAALLDLHLPDMNGLDLARAIARQYPSVAIIILTGSSYFQGHPIEQQIGGFGYLLKTTRPAAVLEYIAGTLARQQAG